MNKSNKSLDKCCILQKSVQNQQKCLGEAAICLTIFMHDGSFILLTKDSNITEKDGSPNVKHLRLFVKG